MSALGILAFIISAILFLAAFCFSSLANILFISSIIGSFICLFLILRNNPLKLFSITLLGISLAYNRVFFELSFIYLLSICFYTIISTTFSLENYESNINFSYILSICSLLLSFIIDLPIYYFIIFYLIFDLSLELIYYSYQLVVTKELERNNIVIKNFLGFEKLSKIKNAVFTKTGVLTLGTLEINKVVCQNEKLFWQYISYGEYTKNDRISYVLLNNSTYDKVDLKKRLDYKEFYNGISYKYGKKEILIGNATFLNENGVGVIEEAIAGTVIYVSVNGKEYGYVVLTDKMRLSTKNIIDKMIECGVENFAIFSNDQEKLTTVVARTLGIKNSFGNLSDISKDFWLNYLKDLYGKDVVLISDDHDDFDVTVIINMGSINFDNNSKSDIILLDNKINGISHLYDISTLYSHLKISTIILNIIGKVLLLFLGFIFVSDLWLLFLINYLWILIEVIVGNFELIK